MTDNSRQQWQKHRRLPTGINTSTIFLRTDNRHEVEAEQASYDWQGDSSSGSVQRALTLVIPFRMLSDAERKQQLR